MSMKIEFLYARSLGRSEQAEEALRLAMEATDVPTEVVYTEVDGMEDAKAKRFLGSPSIRVNGRFPLLQHARGLEAVPARAAYREHDPRTGGEGQGIACGAAACPPFPG